MRLKRNLTLMAAALIGAAVLVSAARERFGAERLPLADDCISSVRVNDCEVDLVVQAGSGEDGRRIWLPPGRALPRDAKPPFHACEIPTLPAELPHRYVPGLTVWGCELPPRLRKD